MPWWLEQSCLCSFLFNGQIIPSFHSLVNCSFLIMSLSRMLMFFMLTTKSDDDAVVLVGQHWSMSVLAQSRQILIVSLSNNLLLSRYALTDNTLLYCFQEWLRGCSIRLRYGTFKSNWRTKNEDLKDFLIYLYLPYVITLFLAKIVYCESHLCPILMNFSVFHFRFTLERWHNVISGINAARGIHPSRSGSFASGFWGKLMVFMKLNRHTARTSVITMLQECFDYH